MKKKQVHFHGNSAPMHEMRKIGALQAANPKDNDKAKDGSITDEIEDPWNPPYPSCPPCNGTKTQWEHAKEV